MAKMGKLTPEELARNKMLMRERDRDRKRLKRMNPEYRKAEQERDRDRKKARRSNEAFRQLEKLRDKIRKERKKGNIVDEAALTAELVNSLPTVPVEPEIIISDQLPVNSTAGVADVSQSEPSSLTQNNRNTTDSNNGPNTQNNITSMNIVNNNSNSNMNNSNSNNNNNTNNSNTNTIRATNLRTTSATPLSLASVISSGGGNNNNNNSNHCNPLVQIPLGPTAAHAMPQLNKGLLYPPPSFAHHPLPIPGVALMPQLCHPILHQNLSATLYPANGIKQEYNSELTPPASSPSGTASNGIQVPTGGGGGGGTAAARGGGGGGGLGGNNRSNTNNSATDEPEMPLIEPEIILQTSTDVIAAPHHFHNHATTAHSHSHHLHQQQCNMFQHMANQQTHHMRGLPLQVGTGQQPTTAHMQHQHQQLQQHYAAVKAAYNSK